MSRSHLIVQPRTDLRGQDDFDDHRRPNIAARKLFIGHKFGGMKGRYRESRGATIRCVDPFTGAPVAFGSELGRENWVLRRFDPAVITTTCLRAPLQIIDNGVVRSALFQLRTDFKDGSTCLDVVLGRSESMSPSGSAHLHVATAFGLRCEFRSRAEIRANPVLLDNLEHFRRFITLHIDQALVSLLPIRAAMASQATYELDVLLSYLEAAAGLGDVLAHLMVIRAYLCGLVHLNVEEVPYGFRTIVKSV